MMFIPPKLFKNGVSFNKGNASLSVLSDIFTSNINVSK